MKLEVTEIFRSIEGETKTTGFPAVFVRLTGCNLNCNYCDSRHAFKRGAQMSIKEIKIAVKELLPAHHITLTGGEPLLQNGATKLIDSLCTLGCSLQIETNGSLPLRGLNENARLIADVKTPSSGSGGTFLMENLDILRPDDELKFVVCTESDYFFAREFISLNKPGVTVNLSPAASLSRRKLAEWVLRDKLNVRLNLQLHKLLGTQ